MDFSKKNLEEGMLVIELNPFHIGAGAGLFSWKVSVVELSTSTNTLSKDDRDIFFNGVEGGFDLRLCTQISEDPYEVLPTKWQTFILERRKAREKKCFIM